MITILGYVGDVRQRKGGGDRMRAEADPVSQRDKVRRWGTCSEEDDQVHLTAR